MNEPASNKSNSVFKRFFRSTRVGNQKNGDATESANENPLTLHLPHIDSATKKVYAKDIETGEPDARAGRCGPFKWFVVWDNTFSLKLLGSKNAIEKEEERRISLAYFIIHPCCRFKSVYKYIFFPAQFMGHSH